MYLKIKTSVDKECPVLLYWKNKLFPQIRLKPISKTICNGNCNIITEDDMIVILYSTTSPEDF